MKLHYLDVLADIVVNVDESKNLADASIVSLTDRAIAVVSKMKAAAIEVGALQEIFSSMQLMCGNRVVITELVEMAHDEIEMLLGDDAWRVYGRDDGSWVYAGAEVLSRVVA